MKVSKGKMQKKGIANDACEYQDKLKAP